MDLWPAPAEIFRNFSTFRRFDENLASLEINRKNFPPASCEDEELAGFEIGSRLDAADLSSLMNNSEFLRRCKC
jgi:hypothetical protein